MRHVTDGELHAFLDGGLDLLPDGRGEEIRSHIADCPVCRERLQDEDAIRSQAEGILGSPELSEIALPTFEELRERAEAPLPEPLEEEGEKVRYRGPLKGLPLAWAATIVLALGVGWMGGEVFRTLPNEGRPRSPAAFVEGLPLSEDLQGDPVADSVSEPALALEEAVARVEQAPTEGGVEDEAEEVQSPSVVTGAVVEAERADEARAREEPADRPEPEAAQAVIPETVSREPAALPDSGTAGANLVVTAARRDSTVVIAPAVTALNRQMPGADVLALKEVTSESDSLGSALGLPGLAVPGLKVVSIDWEERVPGERALLIRQILSPGDTLELRYLGLLLGTETEPRRELMPLDEVSGRRVYPNVLEASLPPGWAQVVMERERGLLVARAPTDEDHLKALLKTLR
jgi:hypothetical protein